MKKTIVAFAVVCTLPGVLAAADRHKTIDAEIQSLSRQLSDTRRDLHMHPELSNREERTSKVIADRLRSLGIPIETGVAKYGVIATIKGNGPGKTAIFRADIDALPIEETMDVPYKSLNKGVKHACGHDAHTSIALTAAELLWKHRSEFPGTAVVLFQPAEEGPPLGEEGGAALMIKEGVLEKYKPSAMFALHVDPAQEAGIVSWTPGSEFASADRFYITVTGKGTHGAYPHMGIDPIVISAEIITNLQTIASRRIDPIEPVVVTVGAIHGGTRFNIIPDTVQMEGTIRTLSASVRDKTLGLVKSITAGIAEANGASAKVESLLLAPITKNDEKVGLFGEKSLQTTLGPANVLRVLPVMGAEDFGFFSDRIPSFYFKLGIANKERGITANIHTAQFDIDEKSLLIGARAVTNLMMDYLQAK
ncbi:MAG TPA: M20 family metallopeptidase [Thermoanaerobaculia bacterium]|nr:M20 family metallopeptidase [Thermoanaerobaculia bacterium]